MAMNSLQYATSPLLDVVRWPLMGVYTATADQKVGNPAAPPDGNNFNWFKGRGFAQHRAGARPGSCWAKTAARPPSTPSSPPTSRCW